MCSFFLSLWNCLHIYNKAIAVPMFIIYIFICLLAGCVDVGEGVKKGVEMMLLLF